MFNNKKYREFKCLSLSVPNFNKNQSELVEHQDSGWEIINVEILPETSSYYESYTFLLGLPREDETKLRLKD